jgi:hypothetical protein
MKSLPPFMSAVYEANEASRVGRDAGLTMEAVRSMVAFTASLCASMGTPAVTDVLAPLAPQLALFLQGVVSGLMASAAASIPAFVPQLARQLFCLFGLQLMSSPHVVQSSVDDAVGACAMVFEWASAPLEVLQSAFGFLELLVKRRHALGLESGASISEEACARIVTSVHFLLARVCSASVDDGVVCFLLDVIGVLVDRESPCLECMASSVQAGIVDAVLALPARFGTNEVVLASVVALCGKLQWMPIVDVEVMVKIAAIAAAIAHAGPRTPELIRSLVSLLADLSYYDDDDDDDDDDEDFQDDDSILAVALLGGGSGGSGGSCAPVPGEVVSSAVGPKPSRVVEALVRHGVCGWLEAIVSAVGPAMGLPPVVTEWALLCLSNIWADTVVVDGQSTLNWFPEARMESLMQALLHLSRHGHCKVRVNVCALLEILMSCCLKPHGCSSAWQMVIHNYGPLMVQAMCVLVGDLVSARRSYNDILQSVVTLLYKVLVHDLYGDADPDDDEDRHQHPLLRGISIGVIPKSALDSLQRALQTYELGCRKDGDSDRPSSSSLFVLAVKELLEVL